MTFNEGTPFEIRRQILMYQASACMSDVERAKFLGLPNGCRIRENAKIISPENLTMGEHCWVGEGAILDASGGLTIGSHTSIGLSVFIWSHDSHKLNLRGANTRDKQHLIRRKPTVIGNNCFLAGPSVIFAGVTIGDNCLISPMSVVTKDVPGHSIISPHTDDLERDEKIAKLQSKVEALEVLVHKLQYKST
jgi:acetyltransferase-like isoleucine patch superfamily enzyme